MKPLLIIAPDGRLIAALQKSLSHMSSSGRAVIVRMYPSASQLQKLLDAEKPRAVVVGLSDSEQALSLIERLRADHPNTVVAAAHMQNLPDLILGAIRAGAVEYLAPPFPVEDMERVLQRTVEIPGPKVQGRLVAFMPAHGGSGASTVAMNVAAAISRGSGKSTLLVDWDFHTGAVDFRLRLKPKFTVSHALERGECLDELWGQLVCRSNGVDVLTGPAGFALKAEDLERAPSLFSSARKNYEWVIADLPPATFSSCRDVLAQAETVYLVCPLELVSLHLARRKALELCDLGFPREALRLVVNRVVAGSPLGPKEIMDIVKIPVASGLPNDYQAVTHASMKGDLVRESSPLGKQFLNFAHQILGTPAPAVEKGRTLNWKNALSYCKESLQPMPTKIRGLLAAPNALVRQAPQRLLSREFWTKTYGKLGLHKPAR